MLPEPDLFQCGTPTCGTLGRRRRELEEADRSPGQTVLGPENQQLTLSRGMLNHLEGGGQATLMRGRKPVQVYSSLLAPATANAVMAEQERGAAGLAGSGRRWGWRIFSGVLSYFPGGTFLSLYFSTSASSPPSA